MIRNSMRSNRLLSWRCLRWAIVIPALPFLWWACTSHPLTQPNPEPEMQTDVYISVAPVRRLDLVFMVDNSPSMAPKVAKMNAQFPKLIKALEDPTDGTLPDVRVAVINSDLGTAGAFRDNSCAAKQLPDGTPSIFGDLGRFQMLKKPNNCTFNDGALFLEYMAGQPVNYTGDINNVFTCLASNLGTMGCGEEHVIQAFEFALVAQGVGNEEQQAKFLRRSAYLGLVFLTDEDDCSAATNDRLFGDLQDARGDSASLRCATRAHKCGGDVLGKPDPDRKVLPEYPTVRDYSHPFADCEAWVGDWCGPDEDTSKPTPNCNPLRDIRTFADEIKTLRNDPDNEILVAGIFGWPMDDPKDPNVFQQNMEKAEYKIAKVPNPNTADTIHPQVYDYWPVCYDPDHKPSDARKDPTTGFDVEAAGFGATGGLRNAAFVDEFGENGLKFSICHRDFSESMKKIGDAIAKKLQNLCVDYKLVDTNTDKEGVQADCRVVWRIPEIGSDGKVTLKESPTSLPQCLDGATPDNIDGDCWYLTRDKVKCEVNGQLIQVMRTRQRMRDQPQLEAGTKIGMQCRTCTDPVAVTNPDPNAPLEIQKGCDYQLQ